MTRRLDAGVVSLALLMVTSIAYASVDFTAADVPTIFYVDKSDDRNRVDYGIRLDARCLPTSGSPMVVYWREFERGSGGRVTHGLNIFEGPVYGVGSQTITERRPDGATLDVTVRALSSRRLTVRTGPATGGGCTATATTTIGGVRAVLDHVHLTLGDGAGSLRHADIYGTAVGGGPVTERVVH